MIIHGLAHDYKETLQHGYQQSTTNDVALLISRHIIRQLLEINFNQHSTR